MRLLTLGGRYAGEVRDYSYLVGLAAIAAGTAESLDAPAVTVTPAQKPAAPRLARGDRSKKV